MKILAVGVCVVLACSSSKREEPPAPIVVVTDAAPPLPPLPHTPAWKVTTADAVTEASPNGPTGPAVVVTNEVAAVDGAALMAAHRKRLTADTSPITVLAGATPRELGQKLCEQVVPRRPAATPVLVKPNMGGFNWFHNPKTHNGDNGVKGRITDPEFTRGVIKCLKARGHTQITVADGFTGKASDWTRLIAISGYGAMAKEEGVTLVGLDDDGVFDVEGDQPGKPLPITGLETTTIPTLLMPKILAKHLQRGLFISLPKLKTHRFSVFSVAIKGMQGTVMYSDGSPAFRQKWRNHRELGAALAAIKRGDANGRALYIKALEKFADRMVDVLELETPDAVLVEGAPAMDGDGFDRLYPRAENIGLGGTNPVLIDRVAAAYLGLWDNDALAQEIGHRTSPLLEVAAKRYGLDIAAMPTLVGEGAAIFDHAFQPHFHGMAGFDIGAAAPTADTTTPDCAIKDLHAVKAQTAPVIDGEIDAAWEAGIPFESAHDWAGNVVPTLTRVRALWSPDALYLLWELEGAGLHTDLSYPVSEERVDLYKEDCVELFLAPNAATRGAYAEIEVGPHGHVFDLWIDRTGKKVKSDAAWSGGLTVGTTRDATARRAVIEVAITNPAIIAALVPDARLPIGLYRMEGKAPRQYLAFFPTRTPKPSFHVPDAFGTLVIDP